MCTFVQGGGAITLNANTDVVVENCSFMENLVSKDGYNPEIGGAAIHIVTVEEPYHIGKGFSEAVVANCRGQENQPCAVAWVTLEGVNKGCRRETSGAQLPHLLVREFPMNEDHRNACSNSVLHRLR